MAIFGKAPQEKQNQQQEALERKLKQLKADNNANEESFREALRHLASTAEGIDQEIDFQVKRVLAQLESHADADHLCNTARAIIETKKKLSSNLGGGLKETIKRLIELGHTLPQADKIEKEIKSFEKKLPELEDKDAPALLQSITQLLKKGLPSNEVHFETEQKEKKSWFSQIFQSTPKTDYLEPLITILNYLLSHLNVPANMEDDLLRIQELISSKSESDILTALDLASQLVIKVHQSNEAQFNRFLDELNTQINAIEELLFSQEKNQLKQKDHTLEFNDSLQDDLNSFSKGVKDYQDIGSLKTHVTESMGKVMSKVKLFTEKQVEIHQENEQEILKLNEKVRETELVTHTLIDELSKTTLEALQDPLTKLPNRNAYDQRIQDEYARWKRYDHNLFIIVCDIDHFKSVNDTYGHQAGDKVIYQVAQTIKSTLRKVDFAGRYGGEEFVILIEKVSFEDAQEICEKIRSRIELLGFHFNQQPVKVTASLGLTQFKEGDTPEDAFERADKALYQSKHNGRNQVSSL